MTAITLNPSIADGRSARDGRLAGFRALFAKDLAEWRRGRRAVVILAVTSLFMIFTAANSAIVAWLAANAPGSEGLADGVSQAPLDNLMAAVAGQIFVFAAIFAAMSLLVAERDRGTLSWVASKPVSRGAIWTSKWVAGSIVVWVAGALLPVVLSAGAVAVLYGMPSPSAVLILVVGAAAAIAFYVAVILAASTVVSSQPAVAAIGFAAFVLPAILVGLIPVGPFLPTSILAWAMGLATGADVGFVTPVAWAISLVALVAVSVWRMERLEL